MENPAIERIENEIETINVTLESYKEDIATLFKELKQVRSKEPSINESNKDIKAPINKAKKRTRQKIFKIPLPVSGKFLNKLLSTYIINMKEHDDFHITSENDELIIDVLEWF